MYSVVSSPAHHCRNHPFCCLKQQVMLFYCCLVFPGRNVPQLIRSSISRHLGCFQALAIINKICTSFLCEHRFSFHLNNSKLDCWVHKLSKCFPLWETARLFSKVAVPFFIVPSVYESSSYSASLPVLGVVTLFKNHSNMHVVIYPYGSICQVSNVAEHLVICFSASSMSSMVKYLF